MSQLTHFPRLLDLQLAQPGLRGVLFDMDGTLLKTEELHAGVLKEMATAWKIRPPFPPEALIEHCKGLSDAQVFELAKSWQGFPISLKVEEFIAEKNRRLLSLIPRSHLSEWSSPLLAEFLRECCKQNILLGLVTSSEKIVTHSLLEAAGLRHLFDLILTLQDVRMPKPHPWPYLMAFTQLGLGIRETVIFEDSPPGLSAARATGAHVIEALWWN